MQKSLLLLFFAGLFACTSQSGSATSKLDAAGTEKLIQSEPSLQIVDLRTPQELSNTGKIEGAQNINFYNPDFAAQISKLDKSKPVLVYCAAGTRSGQAAVRLSSMGFKKVYDYTGGMSDWKAKGKKTVQN